MANKICAECTGRITRGKAKAGQINELPQFNHCSCGNTNFSKTYLAILEIKLVSKSRKTYASNLYCVELRSVS